MTAAFALLMLAEAATACAPAGRLGGGALLVRPVGRAEPLPFAHLGPVESVVTRPTEIQHTAAPVKPEEAKGEQPQTDQPEAATPPSPPPACEVISIA